MMPWISASTGTVVPASTNMREPPIACAFGLTVKVVSGVTRPSRSASKSR